MSWEWANAEEQSWCPWARSARGAEPLGCPWSISDLLQLWLWLLSLRMIVQPYTLAKKVSPPSWQLKTKVLTDWPYPAWSASPTSADLWHLWLFEANFPQIVCNHPLLGFSVLSATMPRCLWFPRLLLHQGCLNTSQATLSCNFTVLFLWLKES